MKSFQLVRCETLHPVSSIHNLNQASLEGCKPVVLGINICRLPNYNLLSQHSRQGSSSCWNWRTCKSKGPESLADSLLGCICRHIYSCRNICLPHKKGCSCTCKHKLDTSPIPEGRRQSSNLKEFLHRHIRILWDPKRFCLWRCLNSCACKGRFHCHRQ